MKQQFLLMIDDYMAILPRHKMGVHFLYHVYDYLGKEEGDEIEDCSEDEENLGTRGRYFAF